MRTQILSPEVKPVQYAPSFCNDDSPVKRIENIYPVVTATSLDSYSSVLPCSMNIFTAITKSPSMQAVNDPYIKIKIVEILNALNTALINTPDINNIERCLSKLNLAEQDDDTVLIEWAYRSFRIGFGICKPVEDSYCFFISEDENSFVSETSKIGNNLDRLANSIIQYVLGNT